MNEARALLSNVRALNALFTSFNIKITTVDVAVNNIHIYASPK